MAIKSIKSDKDYRALLKEIEELMMAESGTTEGDKLELMVTLIEDYERRNHLNTGFNFKDN